MLRFHRHGAAAACALFALLTGAASTFGQGPDRRWTIAGFSGAVRFAAISPDGTLAAGAGDDGTVKVWRVSDGRHMVTLDRGMGPSGPFLSVDFSPDGTRVVACGQGGATEWDVRTGAFLRHYGIMESGTDARYSPDGSRILVVGRRVTVGIITDLFDATTGQQVGTFAAGEAVPNRCVFSDDGAFIVTAGRDAFFSMDPGRIRIHDASDLSLIDTFTDPGGIISGLDIHPDNSTFATAAADGHVRIWSISTGQMLRDIPAHPVDARVVAYSDDGAMLASGGLDGVLRIWNPATGALVDAFQAATHGVESIAWSADGQRMLIGSRSDRFSTSPAEDANALAMWDVATGMRLRQYTDIVAPVASVSVAANDSLVAFADNSGRTQIADALTGEILHEFVVPAQFPAVALSPDGSLLAVAADPNSVRFHHTSDGSLSHTLTGFGGFVGPMEFGADATELAVADGVAIRIIRPSDGAVLRSIAPTSARQFSWNASPVLAIAGGAGIATAHLYDSATGQFLRSASTGQQALRGLSVSGDGSMIATAAIPGPAKLWRTSDATLIAELPGSSPSQSVDLSDDASHVATGQLELEPRLALWTSAPSLEADYNGQLGPGVHWVRLGRNRPRVYFQSNRSAIAVIDDPTRVAAGDIDADGDLDGDDASLFVRVLTGDEDLGASRARSDLNSDGAADGDDIALFVAAVTDP
jgi:WD40 repeat protein